VEDEIIQIARETLKRNGSVARICGMHYESTFMSKSKRTKLVDDAEDGYDWVIRTLNNPKDCYDMYRMSTELFFQAA
jgi:hypothetical protein